MHARDAAGSCHAGYSLRSLLSSGHLAVDFKAWISVSEQGGGGPIYQKFRNAPKTSYEDLHILESVAPVEKVSSGMNWKCLSQAAPNRQRSFRGEFLESMGPPQVFIWPDFCLKFFL